MPNFPHPIGSFPEPAGVIEEAGRVGQEPRPRLQPRHAEDREERALQADDPRRPHGQRLPQEPVPGPGTDMQENM